MLRNQQGNELCACYRKIVRRAFKQGYSNKSDLSRRLCLSCPTEVFVSFELFIDLYLVFCRETLDRISGQVPDLFLECSIYREFIGGAAFITLRARIEAAAAVLVKR